MELSGQAGGELCCACVVGWRFAPCGIVRSDLRMLCTMPEFFLDARASTPSAYAALGHLFDWNRLHDHIQPECSALHVDVPSDRMLSSHVH